MSVHVPEHPVIGHTATGHTATGHTATGHTATGHTATGPAADPAADPSATDAPPTVDLIVLAGGRGSRLGGAVKPSVTVAGRTLLSWVLDARGLARQVVVVGPASARPAAGTETSTEVGTGAGKLLWSLEDPPFGGPVAGIAAGLSELDVHKGPKAAHWVLLLACDLPWAAAAASLLVAAASDPDLPGTVDGVHLVDRDGRAQWLAGIYRAGPLRAAVQQVEGAARGASVRNLLAGLTLRGILDETGVGRDVDTWDDVSRTTALLNQSNQSTN